MRKIAIAQDLQMVDSRAQRMARVHLHHTEAETDQGKASRCSSRIAVQNAEIDSACDISRNIATCPLLLYLVPKVPSSLAARGRRRPAELSSACFLSRSCFFSGSPLFVTSVHYRR